MKFADVDRTWGYVDPQVSQVVARIHRLAIGRLAVGRGHIRISVAGAVAIDEPMDRMEQIWSHAIGRYFEPQRAIA